MKHHTPGRITATNNSDVFTHTMLKPKSTSKQLSQSSQKQPLFSFGSKLKVLCIFTIARGGLVDIVPHKGSPLVNVML